MKTFSDLKFKPHAIARRTKDPKSAGAEIAQLSLENGVSVSVIRGSPKFQCGPSSYEVAVSRNGSIEKVHGYQYSKDVTEILKSLQAT